jgi:hypothetical protein
MDSRELLNTSKLLIHLDTIDLDESDLNEGTKKLLEYFGNESLEFRFPPNKFERIDKLGKLNYKYYLNWKKGEIFEIVLKYTENQETRWAFSKQLDLIERITQKVYGKKSILAKERESIIQIYIQEIFNRSDKTGLFVTNNKRLLENRLYLESISYQGKLNIVSPLEACEIVGLFFRNKKKYLVQKNHSFNKGLWHWSFLRMNLDRYNVGDFFIDALARRFSFCSMALDEMGFQFYTKPTNDTANNLIYHFNYFISLITGIFDNLALKTDEFLNINFSNKTQISINPRSGKDFLKEVREKNPQIRNYIDSYHPIIILIHKLRNLIIHGGMIKDFAYEDISPESKWKGNFLEIDAETLQWIKRLKLDSKQNDKFSKWGIYSFHDEFALEPFHFSKQLLNYIIPFINGYLELLGYPSIKDTLFKTENDFKKQIEIFNKTALTCLENC